MSDRVEVPLGHKVTSLLGLGPMPFTKIVKSLGLVGEAARIGATRDPARLSNLERDLRSAVETRAERRIKAAVAREVDPVAADIKALHAEIGVLDHQMASLGSRRYVGPHGESFTAEETAARHDEWSAAVAADTGEGAVHHRRTALATKRVLVRLLGLDVFVLTYLMMSFLNVSYLTFWQSPGGIVKASTALLFGVLGTIGVAMAMKNFGKRHRAYRRPDGSWDFSGAGRVILTIEISAGALLVLAVAVAMAWRFVLDGRGSDRVLTVVMAVLFATVTAAVAYLSYMSEFADGSLLTEAIDAVAPQLHATAVQRSALAKQRSILLENASRLFAQVERADTEIRTGAVRLVRTSPHDRAIRYARSLHQQAGAADDLPRPVLEFAPLDLALDQTRALAEVQAALSGPGSAGATGGSALVVVQ